MKILFACSEVAPFSQTGGLADVCAALPKALAETGCEPVIISPAYRSVFNSGIPLKKSGISFSVPVGEKNVEAVLWKCALPKSNVPIYFIQQDAYYDRSGLYSENGADYQDNCERFIFFSRAVMESIRLLNLKIDVLHTNDWQTGLIPAYLNILYNDKKEYKDIVSIHTIHNLAYQGIFWHWDMILTGIGWEYFTFDQMEFYGKLNLMKTGVMFADGITTVSPRYAMEIQSPIFGCGMESVLQHRSPTLRGILNGVCEKQWNPATDKYIEVPYNSETVFENKPLCKRALQNELGLPDQAEVPLFGVVSRFAHQKGIDLIADVIPLWVEKHGIQFCLLGQGDRGLEGRISDLAQRYPYNVAARFEFSDALSHKIEAGSDVFLMPSRYEPCGLNQMYSQLYGTIPLVHDTGGLADTVVDLNDETTETATGFSFFADNVNDLNTTIWRALNIYWNKKDVWHKMMLNGMRQNWSWSKSAAQYIRFYEKFLSGKKTAVSVEKPS